MVYLRFPRQLWGLLPTQSEGLLAQLLGSSAARGAEDSRSGPTAQGRQTGAGEDCIWRMGIFDAIVMTLFAIFC